MDKKHKFLGVRLPLEEHEFLEKLAKEKNMTITTYLRTELILPKMKKERK